jgi:hypothetical protein
MPAGRRAKEKLPSASVLKVRVTPLSKLSMVTVAFPMRAPEGSEIVPENEAVEASVWLCAAGTSELIKRLATARNKNAGRLLKLGIDGDPP